MGATKRILEILMEQRDGGVMYNAVRFGNVIQSSGSVVPTFLKQLKQGKDLTVTHKRITRYFMTKREAAELILLSPTIAEDKDICLLDMGEPIKIYDLAKSLIEDNKSDSQIVITGLRRGEKLYEELSYNSKTMDRTREEKIFVVKKEIDSRELERLVRRLLVKSLEYELNDADIVSALVNLGFSIRR
jgi:FlaA1/EpsC-like NDP-sugar epimerase